MGEEEKRKGRIRKAESQGETLPRKAVKTKTSQMVDREPEKRDVRQDQGERECIQCVLNHPAMERKVHMPINPSRKM